MKWGLGGMANTHTSKPGVPRPRARQRSGRFRRALMIVCLLPLVLAGLPAFGEAGVDCSPDFLWNERLHLVADPL